MDPSHADGTGGATPDMVAASTADHAISAYDRSGDGTLSLEEFRQWCADVEGMDASTAAGTSTGGSGASSQNGDEGDDWTRPSGASTNDEEGFLNVEDMDTLMGGVAAPGHDGVGADDVGGLDGLEALIRAQEAAE